MNLANIQNQHSLYWIGIRESEILQTDGFFKGSITIFGSNGNSNYAFDSTTSWRFDYNHDNEKLIDFVNETVSKILKNDPEAKFIFYLSEEMYEYNYEVQKNTICQNEYELLKLLGNKIYCKLWLNDSINELPYVTMTGKELLNSNLQMYFKGYDEFVVQSAYSCGGFGTKLFDKKDSTLNDNTLYMVTPYIKKNISLNTHIVIYNDDIIILPPSVQIISLINSMFLYKGADFVAYERLSDKTRNEVYHMVEIIAKKLQYCGYRGVCGIDLLYDINKDIVYFSEINARFQSSTFMLNKVLSSQGLSVQKMHFDAFHNNCCNYKSKLPQHIPYSFYSYQYTKVLDEQLRYFHQALIHNNFEFYDDKLDWNYQLDEYTHLFKVIFQRSIVSWEPDNIIRIPENVTINWIDFATQSNHEDYFVNLKIALINQGVFFSDETMSYIEKCEKINYKEFEAVDMRLINDIYINVPFQVRLSELSPFSIKMFSDNTYGLCYYGIPMNFENNLLEVTIRTIDPFASKQTEQGFLYEDIAYLGIDRLRVYHRQGCYFKQIGQGCQFCDIDDVSSSFSMKDIKEVLDAYKHIPQINHFLIGGGSETPESDFSNIIELSNYIRNTFGKSIYLMSLPPKSVDVLEKLKTAGITEVAFNIEIYNRTLARKYMPGKGKITIDQYLLTLKHAVKLWGNKGAVRSIFIIGLEPKESLLKGIEEICKHGISPILAIFKPISGTVLEYMVPFTTNEVKNIYDETLKICNNYGVELGPQCHYCEDNVLKVSFL